jgi:hypothetical protein
MFFMNEMALADLVFFPALIAAQRAASLHSHRLNAKEGHNELLDRPHLGREHAFAAMVRLRMRRGDRADRRRLHHVAGRAVRERLMMDPIIAGLSTALVAVSGAAMYFLTIGWPPSPL